MSHVHRVKCDTCNVEQVYNGWGKTAWAPAGWTFVAPDFDAAGDPDDAFHFCSATCHAMWAQNRVPSPHAPVPVRT